MRKMGLVLAGGGGRGAYQIGVWKALKETGLEEYITSVSGASVGGLNAALFMQKDLNKAQGIWESISMKKILTSKFDSDHKRFGLFERDGLEKIIDENLDMKCFDDSEYNCWMACVRTEKPGKGIEEILYTTPVGEKVTRKYAYKNIEYFNLKYVNDNKTRKQIILGTSAIPFVFPKEEIEGYKYLDGGARLLHGDNVPVRPLYEIDKCDIILIVHLSNTDKPVSREEFPDSILYEIFPRDNLGGPLDGGGMFDFSAEGAKRRIRQGFEDNYELFTRMKKNINADQELLRILSEEYEKEQMYSRIEEAQQQEVRLVSEDEKKSKEERMFMGTIESVDYYGGYLYSDFAGVIAKMLADYSEDDLTELLCECEMLLQTNDIYLKKLNERGFKKLFNLITGIEGKCNHSIRDNFQLLHKITLAVEKTILSRFGDLTNLICRLRDKQADDNIYLQYCINSLKQKINDCERTTDAVKQKVNLLDWEFHDLNDYVSCSNARKVLQVVSDIYTITGGSCECKNKILESALDKLKVLNVEISPVDFALEIMRDSECLPLYIKDGENYNVDKSDISGYGSIIYQIRDLVIDQNIRKLAVAKKETLDNLCLPLLKESIEEKEIGAANAAIICWHLLDDMKKLHKRIQERMQEIEDQERRRREDIERERREAEVREQQKLRAEREKKKKYSLLLISPSNMLECSLEGYVADSFEPTNDYEIDEKNIDYVKDRIGSFSPAIIVQPDGIAKTDLAIGNNKISLADFYFCLWYKSQERDKSIRSIALLDYYKKNLYVSCYKIEDVDKISKQDPFTIKSSKTRKHIIDAIKENTKENFFNSIPDQEFTLFRIFKSEKYIDKKLEKVDAPFIEISWRDTLKSKEEREKVFRYIYEFKQEVLCQGASLN